MIEPKVNDHQVVFGPVRVSFPALFEKRKFDGDSDENARYMITAMIPKNEKETIKALKAAIKTAETVGQVTVWAKKRVSPEKLTSPLRDGDEMDDPGVYQDHWIIRAKSQHRPGVLNRRKEPITDPEEVYGGCYCLLSVSFFPYNTGGNYGVGCALNHVLKYKDGDRFGGGQSAMETFASVDLGDDDDLDDID